MLHTPRTFSAPIERDPKNPYLLLCVLVLVFLFGCHGITKSGLTELQYQNPPELRHPYLNDIEIEKAE